MKTKTTTCPICGYGTANHNPESHKTSKAQLLAACKTVLNGPTQLDEDVHGEILAVVRAAVVRETLSRDRVEEILETTVSDGQYTYIVDCCKDNDHFLGDTSMADQKAYIVELSEEFLAPA